MKIARETEGLCHELVPSNHKVELKPCEIHILVFLFLLFPCRLPRMDIILVFFYLFFFF